MRTNRVKRLSAIVSVLGAAAMLAVSAAPAPGAAMYEQSVEANGVVKAHSVYYSAGNIYCVNLLNAANHPLVYADTILQRNGETIGYVTDRTNNGTRECWSMSGAYNGQRLGMYTMFRNANGVYFQSFRWITG